MKSRKSQHEEFTEFFENPTRVTLRNIIKKNIGETDYLDFKLEWPDLVKVSKHILALANSGGGALVVGINQGDSGDLKAVGLEKFKDKADIGKIIQKYIPSNVHYFVQDFSYTESEYPSLKGKKFQVLIVEYTKKILPILSLKDGKGIKRNVAYIRSSTETIEAKHSELENLINLRIESGYSSTHLDFQGDLEQLYKLYNYTWSEQDLIEYQYSMTMQDPNIYHEEYISEWDFYKFIDEIIELKKKSIRFKLGIMSGEFKS